jgi:hypothetical protein
LCFHKHHLGSSDFLSQKTPTFASFEETISCHKNTILCKLRRINFLSNKNTFPSKPPRSKFLSQEHLPLQALKKEFRITQKLLPLQALKKQSLVTRTPSFPNTFPCKF